MKNFDKRVIHYVYPLIISFLLASCNSNTITNIERQNPTPAPVVSVSDKTPTDFSKLPSIPVESIIPTPAPIDLSLYTFEVEIRFDATLSRIYVDNGELRESPAKYLLAGGYHNIIAFDLVTKCRIAKEKVMIDKDQVIEYKEKDDCF